MAAIKIGFVLVSNSRRPIPSTRIAVLNMFSFLRAANFQPEIVFEPQEVTEKPDVVWDRPDLERLAVDFARELRKAAWNTESVGENALGDLRSILEDALTRIKDEVFGGKSAEGTKPASGPDQAPKQDPERNDTSDS